MSTQSEGNPGESFVHQVLERIDEALDRGDLRQTRIVADEWRRSRGHDDSSAAGAHVLLRLAYCDFHQARLQRARAGASQAAQRFRQLARPIDEVEALSLQARAAAWLGRNVEAVDNALLASRLAENLPPTLVTIRAITGLAVAYGWGRRHALAARAFDTAMQLAQRHGTEVSQLEVLVERHWVLAVRRAGERQGAEPPSEGDGVAQMATLLERTQARSAGTPLMRGAASLLPFSTKLVCSLMALWSDDPERASAFLDRCVIPAEPDGTSAWMPVAGSWVHAEMARTRGELDAALIHLSRMTAWAEGIEHLPLAVLGRQLTADVHRLTGRHLEAYNELARAMSLERAMQDHQLEAREGLAHRLATARQDEQRIKALTADSDKFYRWAHEDTLTGIANLRRFDQCLAEWSAAALDSGKPLCVALIDVDRFSHVNNTYGHPVGDKVLRGIAELMVTQVRDADLPARWGGDEFAILFRDTDMAAAEEVARRVEQAVREHAWSDVAPGLQVTVSIGIVEAKPGDTKQTLVKRSDDAMYRNKLARRRNELERSVPKLLVQRVTAWLRRAERVVLLVGASSTDEAVSASPGSSPGTLGDGSEFDRARFGHVEAMELDPSDFAAFWEKWKLAHRTDVPTPTHVAVAALSHRLRQSTVVTERVDGLLGKAGALDVIELFGNAFRERCSACGRARPNTSKGRCLACGSAGQTVRPDIVLLGERLDARLLAGTELVFKRADVVIAVDCDAQTWPTSSLLEKAKARGARVVTIDPGRRMRRVVADVSLAMEPALVLSVLADALGDSSPADDLTGTLTPAGFEALCFLTGNATDDRGQTLEQALEWSNWEIENRLAILPWMFPLTTPSQTNPDAPMPSVADFRALASDERVRHGMRQAFLRMLRFYGFEWREGTVERSAGWREGFATWALTASHHDLFISRILGALTLCGLRDEARAFLQALEPEAMHYRCERARRPLHHWRLAVA